MELDRLGKRVQKLMSLSLAFLLVFLGIDLYVQPVAAATWNTVNSIAAGSQGLLLSDAVVPPFSSNASLSSLLITPTPNSVMSDPATNTYTVEVPYGTTNVTVTPILQDTTATLKVNGTSRANGQATPVTLDADGSTDITIVVTAQDSTTKTYLITVNEAEPSNNGYLSSLNVNSIPVPGFVKTDFNYSMEVPHGTGNIDVSWMLDEPATQTLQAVIIDNVNQLRGPINDLSLTPGVARTIELHVKAQDGTITTYTLSVTEKEALVNKTDLQAKVTEINNEKLVEAEYMPVSWGTLQTALTAAQNLLNNPNATQTEVDDALTALSVARNGLQNVASPVDKSALQVKVTEINNEKLVEAKYTPGSWNSLQTALTAAQNLLNKPNATQTEVDDALAALSAARNGLQRVVPSVDKSALQAKVTAVTGENLNPETYTTTSWRALQTALTVANDVLANANAAQADVDHALVALTNARQSLVKRGNSSTGGGGIVEPKPNTPEIIEEPEPSTPEVDREKNDQKGYMNGYTSGKFEPDRNVTRAELATTLVNAGLIKQASSANGNFIDVADNHWAADAIQRMNAAGLMNGYPNGMFQPAGEITRAEMAAIIFRYLDLSGEGISNNFSDVAADHWSSQMIAAIRKAGLMSGYPDGTFHPEKTLTRAEMVTILNRLLSEDQLNDVNEQTWPDVPPTHWAFKDIEAVSKK